MLKLLVNNVFLFSFSKKSSYMQVNVGLETNFWNCWFIMFFKKNSQNNAFFANNV